MIEFTKQTDLPRFEKRWGCLLTAGGLTPIENELDRPLSAFEILAFLGLAYSIQLPDERRNGAYRPAIAMCNYKNHTNFKPGAPPEREGWDWAADSEYHDYGIDIGAFLTEAFVCFGIEHPRGRYDLIKYKTPWGYHFTSRINGKIEINPDPSVTLLSQEEIIPIRLG